jgi:metallo-beta-lactamase family protein
LFSEVLFYNTVPLQSSTMKVKFCGAARDVTGSAHLIQLESGFTILLDCGLYQGKDKAMAQFNEEWLIRPEEVDCLVLSHAHIDHSGRIPRFVRDGFQGSIFATHATRSLCSIMLLDSAKIQERDAEYYNKRVKRLRKKGRTLSSREPLYRTEDAKEAMNLFHGLPYNHWMPLHPDVDVLFQDAGHILGSANVTLRVREGERQILFGFTGDIGRPDRPILRDPCPMPPCDYVISESTYGNRLHEGKPEESGRLLEIIEQTCLKKKGKLIIPAFSVGRTQELIYMLDQMATAGKLPPIPVYVDSPLAVNATTIFGTHPECFDSQLNEYLLTDDNPFGFNSLNYVRETEMSKQLNHSEEPCIIISSSGMMNAGRVKHHLYHNVDQEKNTFLIVGYCANGTPGRLLRDGIGALKIFGHWKIVKADVEVMDSFSAHADREEMLEFLSNQKTSARRIFLVHGNPDAQDAFAGLLKEQGFQGVTVPELGDEFNL